MAEEKTTKRRIRKSPETVRERTTKSSKETSGKPRRLTKSIGVVSKPLSKARRIGSREYYLPLPDNRLGRFLNKRRRLIPKYFRESWQELRQVTWPGRKETWKLTLAVFIFAIAFGLLVAVVDYGLDKLFKNIILR